MGNSIGFRNNKPGCARVLAISALTLIAAFSAGAEVVNFDDLPANFITGFPPTYAGLNWQGFQALNVPQLIGLDGATAPYATSVVSSPNVAFNFACDAATEAIAHTCNTADFSAAAPFSLDSAYLAGAYQDGLQVLVTGYLGGNVVDSETLTVSYSTGAQLVTFDWLNVDDVTFESWGGTRVAGCCGSGSDFTMDNLTVDLGAGSVPEPSTFMLLASVLAVTGCRRKILSISQ